VTAVSLRRSITATAGFLVTVLVGVLVPFTLLLVAPFVAGETPGTLFDLFVTPIGFVGTALIWLAVVTAGMWLGIRHPNRSFFRGSFLGSFIIIGCIVILLVAALLRRLG
jgi:hypothetical protein